MGFDRILATQNPDGGWGWRPGASSWTEPSAYALLALAAAGARGPAYDKGLQWLRAQQLADGSFRPRPGVERPTTLAALASLVPGVWTGASRRDLTVDWLLRQKGRGSTFFEKFVGPLFRHRVDRPYEFNAWPFVPGTAPWLVPTAWAVLALERVRASRPDVAGRLEAGRTFLLARNCGDGGWNHGSSRALDIDAPSYPETTGVALVALHAVGGPVIERALDLAARQYAGCTSSEGLSWLSLALCAHRRQLPPARPPGKARTTVEVALEAMAAAAAGGRHILLEEP